MGAMEMPTRIKKGTWNRYNPIPTSRPARPKRMYITGLLITFIRCFSWRLMHVSPVISDRDCVWVFATNNFPSGFD